MAEIALYYPYVHPREESWVKQAVLFWPAIQRIVPANYPVRDTPTLQLLVDEGVLTNRLPDRGAVELAASFVEFVADHSDVLRTFYDIETAGALPIRKGWSDPDLNPRLGWIHTGKLAPDAWSALVEARLAVEDREEPTWLGMHPALAETYMCCLAGQLSRLAGGTASPVTDGTMHHVGACGWSIAEVARALLTDLQWDAQPVARDSDSGAQGLLAVIAMEALVLRDLDHVPIEHILKLRFDHEAEFTRYRNGINALAAEVASLDSVKDVDTLAQHIQIRYEQTIGLELDELRSLLKSNGVNTTLTALSLQIVPPSTFLGAVVDSVIGAGAATAAATAVAVTKTAHSVRTARAAAMTQSQAAWLVRIEEDLSPQTLLSRVRASLQRFGS